MREGIPVITCSSPLTRSRSPAPWLGALLAALMAFTAFAAHAQDAQYAGSKACLSCHIDADDAKIDAMLKSAHGDKNNANAPFGGGKGCESCHGASAPHAESPTAVQPLISFGPRWSAAAEAQNAACLHCHENDKTHREWHHSAHAKNDGTCVTCHDLHTTADPVRTAATQADVCTVCHKVQKAGMHNLTEHRADNPPCAKCHDPHNNPSPKLAMLDNRSEGCRHCHDLQKMAANEAVTAKAKNYHKTMQQSSRTCVDCHRGVAHIDKDKFQKILDGGLRQRDVVLFFPAQSDGDWLGTEHAGAQAFRQGRNCTQCHLGEEQAMGQSLAPAGRQSSVTARVAVARQKNHLQLTVSWPGRADDRSVAVMFNNGSVDAFSQGGCWALCHSDMPGMSRDKDRDLQKYLLLSRQQQRSIGKREIIFDEAALETMLTEGKYVSLFRANLDHGALGKLEQFRLLDRRRPQEPATATASAQFSDGRWQVTFAIPLAEAGSAPNDTVYTFGIAIHGAGQRQAKHWVSLPLTVSATGVDTDFALQ